MNEVLDGQRNPEMMERIGFGTDPLAGKHMRLELERFQQVDFRYPAKLVWCGTSLSGGSLDEMEVSKQTRFDVRKLKAEFLSICKQRSGGFEWVGIQKSVHHKLCILFRKSLKLSLQLTPV